MFVRNYWKSLRDAVFSPQIDSAEVNERLLQAQAELPVPVIWLLGKAQSGKTSIVRALTGCTRAEIGDGFRPCTRTASIYAFPDEETCLLKFLDTRGLGEVGYDPTDDMVYCQRHAHLLMVVVKAMDHAQKPIFDALKKIRKAKPNWPIIVVQTALHEGYERNSQAHVLPFPFDAERWPSTIPIDLARSMQHQREEFAGLASRFVAVDLTLAEDGFEPADYGLDSLWATIEEEFPHGLRSMLESKPELKSEFGEIYYRTAWPHIVSYSVAAGAAGAVPVPLVDVPVVIAIQAKLFHAIASIYGQPLTSQLVSEFGGAIGGSILSRVLRSLLTKLVPGFGSVVGAAYNAATTYSMGCTLCWYFAQMRKGCTPDAVKLREFYSKGIEEGRQRFSEYLKRRRVPPAD